MKRLYLLAPALSLAAALPGHAQQNLRTITGTVTAPDRTPLPGVTVLVKGTTTGTSTGADGRYSLQADPGSVLSFSFIGYTTQERAVDDATSIDISLKENTTALKDVVVTAYGIEQERREVNYGVQQVQGKELIDSRQTNVVNALQGKIAGVSITSSGGAPGEGAAIVIRGGASLDGDNQPLFVIDGITMDNNSFTESTLPGGGSSFNGTTGRSVGTTNRASDINPEDIESITVLKGPAAATLYGLRAANGAVIIKTKRGTLGRMSINYRTQFSVDEVNRLPELQNQYGQGSGAVFDATTRTSWGPRFADGQPIYDNLGNIFRKGTTFQNFLNMSGGSEKATYFLSVSQLNQKGVVPRSAYDRVSLRLSGTAQFSPKISATASANYINSGGERPLQANGLFGTGGSPSGFFVSLLNWPRNDDARNYLNPDGTRRRLLAGVGTQDPDNPYFTVERNPQTDRTDRFIGNTSLTYKTTDWLSFNYNVGADLYTERNNSVRAIGTSQVGYQDGGIAQTVTVSRTLTSNLLATLQHQFGENFAGSLVLGNSIDQTRSDETNTLGITFQNPTLVSINNTVFRNALTTIRERRLIGNFARVSLTLFDQVFVELQGRVDQSSTLPRPNENKNYGKVFGYGSASLGYEFTRTLGLDQNPILNYGKLRASVAEVGKDTGPYRVDSPLAQATYIGGGFRNGFFGSNRLLKPERSRSYEAGVELRFLQNRLGLDFNLYESVTRDQLIAPRVSQASGFILQYINGGRVRNRGVEISLNGSPVKGAFTWDVAANFYRNVNKTVELPSVLTVVYQSDAAIIDVAQGGAFPGQAISSIGATDYQRAPDGRILISGTTGLPLVNTAFTYQGNRAPDYTVQLTNTFGYKGLSLAFLLDFRKGGKVVNGNDWYATGRGTSLRTLDRYKQAVFEGVVATTAADGTVTYAPNTRPAELTQAYYQDVLGRVGTAFIEDGSWSRLRYVTLSYSLPSTVFGKSFVKGVELSVTGRNLVLLTNYSGVDPETSAAGAGVRGGGSGGFDYGSVPATRGVDMGLRVNF
jgi:TonB-linked SusC/RagA family outer membrane protein